MERRKEIQLEQNPEVSQSRNISKDGLEVVKTLKDTSGGLHGMTPEGVGFKLVETQLERERMGQNPEFKKSVVRRQLQDFGCTKHEITEIFDAVERMQESDKVEMTGASWKVIKNEDGVFDITVLQTAEVEEQEEETLVPDEEFVVTDSDISDYLQSKPDADKDMDHEKERADDLEDRSNYEAERKDTVQEDNPASQPSKVLAQNDDQ